MSILLWMYSYTILNIRTSIIDKIYLWHLTYAECMPIFAEYESAVRNAQLATGDIHAIETATEFFDT